MAATPWTASTPRVGSSVGPITLVDGATFAVSAGTGDMSAHGAEGLFVLDTRVVATWRLTLDGEPVEGVSSIPDGSFSVSIVGRARADEHADSDLAVVRRRHLGRGMREDIDIRHYGVAPRSVTLGLDVAADFASLFEVKSGHVRSDPLGSPTLTGSRLTVVAPGPAAMHAVVVDFDRAPDRLVGDRVEWDLELAPASKLSLCIEVSIRVEEDDADIVTSGSCGEPVQDGVPVERMAVWRSEAPVLHTDDPRLAEAFDRSLEDLGTLRIFDPDHEDRVVVAAGAPWFMTLFGRDSILAAWMALIVDHDLARGVLASLAEAQGTRVDARTEEQPGRILHEVRADHSSTGLLGGSSVYYGTVDATPLFVMLVGELARWTGDRAGIAPLMPAVDRALGWMETHADRDGDGFVEYGRTNDDGLENQGWKDSWDGIRYADGRVATAPIALCEVQGYSYAAYRARAALATLFGDGDGAREFDARADELAQRFDEAFWVPDKGWYAVGLDASKGHIDSLTSNLGHCLWTGIVPTGRAGRLAELLGSAHLFSGWGVRTLAADSGGFNPLSYHCGSVWPHDTALAIAGLARYHHDGAAATLTSGLLDAATSDGGRLPELFAGFGHDDLAAPVPYPASCAPQAWAAASPLMIVRSILGLEPDLVEGVVRVRPRLPPGMDQLVIEGVPIGDRRVDIRASGDGIEISGLPDGVTVAAS